MPNGKANYRQVLVARAVEGTIPLKSIRPLDSLNTVITYSVRMASPMHFTLAFLLKRGIDAKCDLLRRDEELPPMVRLHYTMPFARIKHYV